MATGSVIGAVIGALSLWFATAVLGVGPSGSNGALLLAGAEAGALTGAVLAPVSAWSLTRYVPLWRAIGEPGLGAILCSMAGSAAASVLHGGLAWSILGALIGFVVAAVRLRIVQARQKALPAPAHTNIL